MKRLQQQINTKKKKKTQTGQNNPTRQPSA